MLYCTYDQYQTAGGTLDEAAFTPLCFRASKLIDRATFGRAEPHAAGCEDGHPLGQPRSIRRREDPERLQVRMVALAPCADDGGAGGEGKRCGGAADGT